MAPVPSLTNGGLYKIINMAGGNVITVSTSDGTTVQAYRDKNLDNQMWRATNYGSDQWTLKSLYQHNGRDVYLDYSSLRENGAVIGSQYQYKWLITQWQTHGGSDYRIWCTPGGTNYTINLNGNYGADGVSVVLRSPADSSQFWLIQWIPDPD